MSTRNRVIWSEGLFIKPQHFQQQFRYTENQLQQNTKAVSEYLYGLMSLEINAEYLSFGRISLVSAAGMTPDGTSFEFPLLDDLPAPLDVTDASYANQIIYLAIPLREDSLKEITWQDDLGHSRYKASSQLTRDIHSRDGDDVQLDVAKVNLRLMFEREDRSAFSSLPIARILEKRPDGSVVLDPDFMPCSLTVAAIPQLHRFVGEMGGLMRERAKNIAERLGAPGQSGVAEVTDFMLLQVLNRVHQWFTHLSRLAVLHPERLYEALLQVASELITYTQEGRLPQEFPAYDHDYPQQSFRALMHSLQQSLSTVLEPRAVAIPLEKRKFGLMGAAIADRTLLESADFVIAVRANLPLDTLRKQFVQQTKVASVEKIRDLISLQIPGIELISLPVAPRQLPYHAGFTYFQLDRNSANWSMLEESNGFAFHVAGDIPNLELQFWAIRT
ncbi:MAG: type VI secretion system baseplate subunit TssK [Pseudomonadales bacterium]